MTAEDGLVKVALLDIGRQTGARAAALDIDNDERDLRHRGPADGLRLSEMPGPALPVTARWPPIGKAERHRDGGQFILALDEQPAVFRELAARRSP